MKKNPFRLVVITICVVMCGVLVNQVTASSVYTHPFTNTTNLTFSNSIDTHTMVPGCDGSSPTSYTWSLTVNGVSISGTHNCPALDPGPTGLGVSPKACSTGQNHLDWDDTPGATSYSVYLSDNTWLGNSLGSDFTHTGNMNTTYDYYVRSSNAMGVLSANSAVVTGTTAAACPTPVVSLDASPTSVDTGDSSTLTWTATDATSCTASGGWSGSKDSVGGSESVTPTIVNTYNLSCTGPGGTTSATPVTITRPIGSITASSCTILSAGTSCNVSVNWSTSDFIGAPDVAQEGTSFSSSPIGSELRTVTPDDNTFTLSDTGGVFAVSTVATVSCGAGTVWVSAISSCAPLPVVNIYSDTDLIRSGSTEDYEISINSNLDLTCTVRDGGAPVDFTHTASPTTQIYSRTSRPLTSAQIIDVSCVSPLYPAVNSEDQMRVEVIPTIQEV